MDMNMETTALLEVQSASGRVGEWKKTMDTLHHSGLRV